MAAITEKQVLDALRVVQDPDLHRDIVDLEFVKNLKIEGGAVKFDVQLTTPACPVKEDLKAQAIQAVNDLPGVTSVDVTMTAQVPKSASTKKTENLKDVRHIIAVASGKGGVGKSTATANLAVALAQTGASVGVLDADIYGPSMSMMFQVKESPVLDDKQKLHPVVVNGIKIVSMAMFADDEKPVIWRGPMVSQMIQNFVHNVVWGSLDYLLIDMPPGTGDVQLTLTQSAPLSGGVIVTTPQDVSVLDAKKGLKMFQKVSVPVLGIIENMSYFICDNCEKKHYIFRQGGGKRISTSLGLPFLGEIPLEPEVAVGGDVGLPIVEKNPASASAKAYRDIAGLIAQQLSILSASQSGVLGDFDYTWESLPKGESLPETGSALPKAGSALPKDPAAEGPKLTFRAKNTTKVVAPIALFRKDPDILSIAWNDGSVSDLKVKDLRSACPCAVCVNEWTGEKMLDESRIPADIRPARLLAVGRYAVAIHWSDGHKTGIYSYDYLKRLDPATPKNGDGPLAPKAAKGA